MDSLTQLALGAAVGEATAGRQVGRRALLWGAALGTMPDLDVFIPLGDAVRDFTYHRSASHSLFVLLALTPLMVWLILKLHPGTAEHRRRWVVLVYLVFATHVLLDSFTVYGTQIFWPFFTTPMTWSTIFIIDPLYTVPLLLGIIAALIAARDRTWGHTANMIGLVLSSGYLVWTVGVKLHVEQVARNALQQQEVVSSAVLTTPTPFNSLLWRILAVNEEHYYEGFYSVLDDEPRIRFERYPRMRELVAPLHDSWPVQRLQWFTKGFYAASLKDRNIIVTDLRMGFEPEYVFRFKVGELSNPHPRPTAVERQPGIRNFERLRWVWARIWNEKA
ncbi:MAG: metal-dependent hydrolase [Gammaproteobacteria bacterium]|nr:metal-dependent hydrolase [Gammaproteobacteria bacterium]